MRYPLLRYGLLMSLCACQTSADLQDHLQRHSWTLFSIDRQIVSDAYPGAVTLDITQNMTVEGHSGCNRFFGKGVLNGDHLQISGLGMTTRACPAERRWIENAVITAFRDGSNIELNDDSQMLTVKNARHTLIYRQADQKE